MFLWADTASMVQQLWYQVRPEVDQASNSRNRKQIRYYNPCHHSRPIGRCFYTTLFTAAISAPPDSFVGEEKFHHVIA
jgi:hypothetical protein